MKTLIKREFRVASVSDNTNLFGLRGYILISASGEAWEVGRSDHAALPSWVKGQDIEVPGEMNDGVITLCWAQVGCEIPRQLPKAPPKVIEELFGEDSDEGPTAQVHETR